MIDEESKSSPRPGHGSLWFRGGIRRGPRRRRRRNAFPGLLVGALRHFLDDGRLANPRFLAFQSGQLADLVERILKVVNIAMELVHFLGQPLDRVFRRLVGEDEQVILGNPDDKSGQPDREAASARS